MAFYFDLHDKQKRDFIHLTVNEVWDVGLWNEGGPPLASVIDDPSIAVKVSETETTPGIYKVRFKALASGHTLVRAKNSAGNQWGLTQLVVRQAVSTAVIDSSPATGKFDSKLDVSKMNQKTNAELVLTVKLFFKQDAAGSTVIDWPGPTAASFIAKQWEPPGTLPKKWPEYKASARSAIERAYDARFWLVPPRQYFPLVKDGYVHNLHCRLKIQLAPSALAAHRVVNVIALSAIDPDFRSNASTSSAQFTNRDLKPEIRPFNGKTYSQRTVVHEFLHMLGISPHAGNANPLCTAAQNWDCYCAASDNCYSASGLGETVTVDHAFPWLNRAALHTGTKTTDWTASLVYLPPKPL